jgi:hypothetical protein
MSSFSTLSSMGRSFFERLSGKPSRRQSPRSRRPRGQFVCERLEDRSVPSAVSDILGSVPMSFEANHGQADAAVRFSSRGPGYGLSLTETEAVLTLNGSAAGQGIGPHPATGAVIRMQVVGANPAAGASGRDRLPGVVNYFVDDDSARWRTDVPTFGRVEYDAVYPGIDLVYYGNQQQLEYDFVVAPGADPSRIRLAFGGADRVSLDALGNLVLHTAGGDVIQHAPVLYQQDGPGRTPVAGAFRLEGDQVTFQVGAYDAGRPLVIDPVLSYATYLGGIGFDAGFAIAVDGDGSAYVTGQTGATDFPTTSGAFRTGLGDTYNAAFITKLNPAGTALVYSTYLGGGMFSQTVGYGIAVDAGGNAYVTGETSSADFPTTAGAFQSPSPMGYDAFVTKLNAQGNGLVYSVRLGGLGDDFGRGIAVDADGRAVVTGWLTNPTLTPAAGFPTANAFQPGYGGGFQDAFVTRLSADGSSLVFSTYLGGASFASDWGQAVAVDSAGNSYVTGHTYALDFPTTPGAFQRGGAVGLNAFVTKFTPAGAVAYSTHALGGSGHDEAWGIAVDAAGNAYVTGNTDSWDDPSTSIDTGFPTTPGAYRRTLVGQIDAYVAKLNASGSALVYGTYLGGSADFGDPGYGVDRGFGIAVDSAGSAYVTGDTDSPNFPVVNPIQTFNYWYSDAFVAELNPAGSALVYSTFLGGEFTDQGRGVALDTAGNAYVTGSTGSFGFPTTPGAFQAANAGGLNDHTDAFVARISAGVEPPPLPSLSITDVARAEGHRGLTQFTVTVSLSSASNRAVTCAYATADGTATAGSDYQAASGTLIIPAGLTTGTITVLVNGDRAGEANETFVVNLSGATSATIADGQGVGTILDDDGRRISIRDVAKVEGKRGRTTLFVFTVTLSAAYDQPVTTSFHTANGTATTGDGDYVAKSGTLTFAPGETTKTITIEVKGDSRKEADERFYLDLFGNSGNSLFTDSRGIGTIIPPREAEDLAADTGP